VIPEVGGPEVVGADLDPEVVDALGLQVVSSVDCSDTSQGIKKRGVRAKEGWHGPKRKEDMLSDSRSCSSNRRHSFTFTCFIFARGARACEGGCMCVCKFSKVQKCKGGGGLG
jgi:hypothetical protein